MAINSEERNARLAESKYLILKKRQKKTRITGAVLFAIGSVILTFWFAVKEFAILPIAGTAMLVGLLMFIRSFANRQFFVLDQGNGEETYKITKRDPDDGLMLSQYAAFYVYRNSKSYRKRYVKKLAKLEFTKQEAQRLFDFECDVLTRFNKPYMLRLDFTEKWFFGLTQPLFLAYPKEQDDIFKERFLTLGELCKIVDEAEWHFINSRERPLPDGVWIEILTWRMKGPGGEFGRKYFEMISEVTDIPIEKIGNYTSNEARRLNMYKWN